MVVEDQRIELTIPFPSQMPRGRGIHAVSKDYGSVRSDLSVDEQDLVEEAAAKCGLSKSMFIRSVIVHAAKEVLK
jgi:hypothetical protein